MNNLGYGGPPDYAPTPPENIDLTAEEVAEADTEIDHKNNTVVYRGETRQQGTTVQFALKKPRSEDTITKEVYDRFVTEAETWHKLTETDSTAKRNERFTPDDYIVDIFDWGEQPIPWIALEYMDGPSLAEILSDGPLPVGQALWVGRGICRAVWHAHRNSVIHRDIKPSNILFRETPGWLFPKVTDWGISETLTDKTAQTAGLTPAYAAPEQLFPEEYPAPRRQTDIYQIGTVLYELITGELPFPDSTGGSRQAKRAGKPIPPSERVMLPDEIADAVDQTILRALNPSMEARYEAAVYFGDELHGLWEQSRAIESDQIAPDSSTKTTSTAVSEDTANDPSTEASEQSWETWNEYNRQLQERQQRFGYNILPSSLRRLVYDDLVAEVERAERERSNAQAKFEELKNSARRLNDYVEQIKRDDGRFGQQLPEDAQEKKYEIEDVRGRITTLLNDRTYLEQWEQEQLTELADKLAAHEAYLEAKLRFDTAVPPIQAQLDELHGKVESTLTDDELISEQAEDDLINELDNISGVLRETRIELPTDELTPRDIDRLDTLSQQENTLRERVTTHNYNVVQRAYERVIEEVSKADDTIAGAIRSYQNKDGFKEEVVEYINQIEENIEKIDQLRQTAGSRQEALLEPQQKTRLDKIANNLQSHRELLQDKQQFDTKFPTIREDIESINTKINQTVTEDSLISESEKTALVDELSTIEQRIEQIQAEIDTERLNEDDQHQLDTAAQEVADLRDDIENHNQTIAQERYSGTIESVSTTANELATAISSYQSGDQLEAPPSTYIKGIENAIEEIEQRLDSRETIFLKPKQQAELEERRERLRVYKTFFEQKATFEDRIRTLESKVDELEESTTAILSEGEYLKQSDYEKLMDQINEVRGYVGNIEGENILEDLNDSDNSQFESYSETIEEIAQEVSTHNANYIESKREKYAETFSDLSAENLSLNKAQEKAIFTNEVHNRIIAGPGTGKTTALASRIRYLREEGVSSDQLLPLSFDNKASEQIEDKLQKLYDIDSVSARTLASIGGKILNKADPDSLILVEETRIQEIRRIVDEMYGTDEMFTDSYEAFIQEFKQNFYASTAGSKKDDVYNSIKRSSRKMWGGETVSSDSREIVDAHTTIGNTLFEHDIEYRYQQYAHWVDHPAGKEYIPDFTLPQETLCIEYLPTDHAKKSQSRYERKPSADQIQALFADTDWDVIILHGADMSAATVDRNLKAKLDINGVDVQKYSISEQELKRQVYEHNTVVRPVIEHIAEFIKKAKTNQVSVSDELEQLDSDDDSMIYHFSQTAAYVYDEYVQAYEQYGAYDYADMILEATRLVEDGTRIDLIERDHILIDEFQDLNLAQIEFVQAILNLNNESHLFAVGDDWQSIYGFKGARPEYFVNFDQYFSPQETTALEINYRCPPDIVQASNELMSGTKQATSKTLRAADQSDDTEASITIHVVPGRNGYEYETNAVTRIVELVQNSLQEYEYDYNDILVLARNREGSPYIPRVTAELEKLDIPVGGQSGIRVTNAHQAKGTEAKHVIIANVVGDAEDGFPAKERRKLSQIVDRGADSHIAEERRLFYMTMTRAVDRLDIQTHYSRESDFLEPIREYAAEKNVVFDPEQDRVSVTAYVRDSREDLAGRQLGDIQIGDYNLSYIIVESAEEQKLLRPQKEYQIDNAAVGEYDDAVQLRIDSKSEIYPISSIAE